MRDDPSQSLEGLVYLSHSVPLPRVGGFASVLAQGGGFLFLFMGFVLPRPRLRQRLLRRLRNPPQRPGSQRVLILLDRGRGALEVVVVVVRVGVVQIGKLGGQPLR